jgi:kumamolisin
MAQQVPLPKSDRAPMAGATVAGPADAGERCDVSVLIRRRGAAAFEARLSKLHRRDSDAPRHLTREEYAQQHGADPKHCAAIAAFAQNYGLTVAHEHGARRTMVLSGTVAQFNAAFGIDLQRFRYPGGFYRGWTGPLHVPTELADVIESVLGLDDRPQASAHRRARGAVISARPAASYTPPQIASLYGFPAGTGSGQTIALIELGGGFVASDLDAYFSGLGIGAPPAVVAVGVDQASNAPTGDPNGPDGEVMLDIEVAGALAPQAQIAVYFAPNTDAGFLDATTTAIHDATHKPSVISISWGGPESSWSKQALDSFDQAFQDAASLGITVCVAAGDTGSSDGLSGDNVDFPASSPHVLACGGTRLQASGASIQAETVWNDGPGAGATGGGVSTSFPLPVWQQGLSVTKTVGGTAALQARGVPDVAGDADPQTGYQVRADGQQLVFGGTSAVAPLWAALIARINSLKGAAAGFVNPTLYANAGAFNDVTQGDNGDFAAAPGWDACTGLGSPKGADVKKALGG